MKGINAKDLKAGDVVEVTTGFHVYTLKILDPEKRTVELTSNNPRAAGPAVYVLEGSFDNYSEALEHNPYTDKHFQVLIENNRRLLFEPFLFLSVAQTISVNGKMIWATD